MSINKPDFELPASSSCDGNCYCPTVNENEVIIKNEIPIHKICCGKVKVESIIKEKKKRKKE